MVARAARWSSSTVGDGALMGSANYHARIRFDDGSPSWLLCVPRVATFAGAIPSSLVEYLVLSEYATLNFLETTAVPAPHAFGHGISGAGTDHGNGVSFILMEELRGTPWVGQGMSGGDASADEKAKVWGSLADIVMELKKHPFPKAGSLCLQSSEIEVSAIASDRLIVLTPRVYRFLKDDATQLRSRDENEVEERFYLKHVDDKGDHLLVDEELNTTGIIDWQMARIVPRREAFGPSLVTADMSVLCQGKISLSPNDLILAVMLQQRGLSSVADTDEKARRYFWGLALESEWKYALPLANTILEVFGVGQDWAQWKETGLKAYETDERLKGLIDSSSVGRQAHSAY